jgi:hypothetical protein
MSSRTEKQLKTTHKFDISNLPPKRNPKETNYKENEQEISLTNRCKLIKYFI